VRGPLTERIAAAIRVADGDHSLGAAKLADKIVELVPELGVANEIASQRITNHLRWGVKSIEGKHWTYRGWMPTLMEEVGEVAREMQGEDVPRLRAECVDVMGVAWMLIDSIDEDTPIEHQHEPWQIQPSTDGMYCTACGRKTSDE
jgi:NTP pyrophosphatase (non-canonical NTP hydrolase)